MTAETAGRAEARVPRSSLLRSGAAAGIAAALSGILLVGGCASAPMAEPVVNREGFQAQAVLFLKGMPKPMNNITMSIMSLRLVADDGTQKELLNGPLVANSLELENRQILLAERMLPEARYNRLRLTVGKASVKRGDKIADLALPSEEFEMPLVFATQNRKSSALFLTWNADASIVDGFQFKPSFDVRGPVPDLLSLMIYVPNELSGNVYVVNRQTDEVVNAIMVGNRPMDAVASDKRDRRRVYVVNAGSGTLSVIDPNTSTVENEIPIRYGKDPVAIGVVLTPVGKELIFVANYGSNNISVVDGSSSQEIQRLDAGRGPVAVAVDPPAEMVLGARFLSAEDRNAIMLYRERFSNVYVANRHSRTVTVFRVNNQNGFAEPLATVEVDWEPVGLFVDYGRGKVYAVNSAADTLSAISIPQLIRGNAGAAVTTVTNVGHAGVDIITDPGFDRYYLLKESGEIVIFRLAWDNRTGTKSVMPSVIGSIPVGTGPRALMFDPENVKLYVVNRGSDTVSVIDKTTRRLEKVIPTGRRPSGITLFPN